MVLLFIFIIAVAISVMLYRYYNPIALDHIISTKQFTEVDDAADYI